MGKVDRERRKLWDFGRHYGATKEQLIAAFNSTIDSQPQLCYNGDTMATRAKPDGGFNVNKAKALLVDSHGETITLGGIARGTGLHVTHLSKIFNGHRKPSLKAASKIAAYLGITLEKLNRALEIN